MKKRGTGRKKRRLIFDRKGIEAFAIRLKEVRKKTGISQSQLAFEAGISLSQVARIETARINPTLSTVFAVARALNVSISELFLFNLPTE
ncbi:MAG: helix-turn-helix transcriptional regulator [Bacteroidia bacterium]|nr:helix-turn-helix transcriptional regulator [Bacteroidia bacterium]